MINFFLGFMACLIFFLVSYTVIRLLLSNTTIKGKIEEIIIKETQKLNELKTEIIYPNNTKEIFNSIDSSLEDLLNK